MFLGTTERFQTAGTTPGSRMGTIKVTIEACNPLLSHLKVTSTPAAVRKAGRKWACKKGFAFQCNRWAPSKP